MVDQNSVDNAQLTGVEVRPDQENLGGESTQLMADAHAALAIVKQLHRAGDLKGAQSACAELLEKFPYYVGALYRMGLLLNDRSLFGQALVCLHRAAALLPGDAKILIALGTTHLRMGALPNAVIFFEEARRVAPKDVQALTALGKIYAEQDNYELSNEVFRAVLEVEPNNDIAEIGLCNNLISMGQFEDATSILERRIKIAPRSAADLKGLSEIPRSFLSVDVGELIGDLSPPNELRGKREYIQYLFLSARGFHFQCRYKQAWERLCEANHLMWEALNPQLDSIRAQRVSVQELARACPPPSDLDASKADGEPISLFIAGASCTGKSTLERILGRLPEVKRGYERNFVEQAVLRTFQTADFPSNSNIAELPQNLRAPFRENYNQILLNQDGEFRIITSTKPARVISAIHINAALPNARFIFVKRDTLDLAFRIFMKLYARRNVEAYNIRDIFEHLHWFDEMIELAMDRLKGKALLISYESMIDDPFAVVQAAAKLCGTEIPEGWKPEIGDDRGCSAPYREWMQEKINTSPN